MRSVCLLSVVMLLTGLGAAAQDSAENNPALAVRLASYGKFQDAGWEHLSSIGMHYVFLSVPKPEEVDGIIQRLEKNHLKALVIRGDTDLSKEGCVEELGGQLAICEKLGVHYMFLSAKRNEAPKEVVFERLRKAGDIAKQHGVTITLETHPDLGTNGEVFIETMKAINHPNIRVNLDTANLTYYNHNVDAVTELNKVVDYLGTVEFKDHSGEFETWNFPVLGEGKVDFPKIVETLKAHGYHGPITIEFEGVKGVELNEEQIKQSIADCVAYVRSLGQFR